MKELTKRQREVLEIIETTVRNKGYPPSMREITTQLRLASPAGIHKHIKALVKKGVLAKENFLSRSLRIVGAPGAPGALGVPGISERPGSAPELLELPLVGTIAAGQPIEAVAQAHETLAVPAALLGSGSEHYVLRVRGESMRDDSILDGDYVIVERRQTARNGEVVVALLNGDEATLKRFYRENGQVRLQPANAAMAPIFLTGGDVRVQGVVVAIWRRF